MCFSLPCKRTCNAIFRDLSARAAQFFVLKPRAMTCIVPHVLMRTIYLYMLFEYLLILRRCFGHSLLFLLLLVRACYVWVGVLGERPILTVSHMITTGLD